MTDSSVFSAARDERQCGFQEAYLLANHCETQFMLNSIWKLFHRCQQKDVNSRFECMHTTIGPSIAVVRCSLGSYRLGRQLNTLGCINYNICLASALLVDGNHTFIHTSKHKYVYVTYNVYGRT